jgi:hypothetical protein
MKEPEVIITCATAVGTTGRGCGADRAPWRDAKTHLERTPRNCSPGDQGADIHIRFGWTTDHRLARLPVRPLRPLLSPGRPVLAGVVSVYRWARPHSRRDMAIGRSTRDTQAIPPPTESLSTQMERRRRSAFDISNCQQPRQRALANDRLQLRPEQQIPVGEDRHGALDRLGVEQALCACPIGFSAVW